MMPAKKPLLESAMKRARAKVQAELRKGMVDMIGSWDLSRPGPDPIRVVSLSMPVQLAPFKQLKLGAERIVKPGESATEALVDLHDWLVRESVRIRLKYRGDQPKQPTYEEQVRTARPRIILDDEF